MSFVEKNNLKRIQFYVTTKYSCGYLLHRNAQSIVATPYKRIGANAYNDLIKKGFRRSGQYVYKPHCADCKSCIPIRINSHDFIPSRSQKRVIKKHNHLSMKILPLSFNEDHYELYVNYQKNRHKTSSESESDISDYNDFLAQSNVNSKIFEFRDMNELKIVSIIDLVDDGISAVYTFFDVKDKSASYGTFSILKLIDYCKKNELTYLYLGYWINESRKMRYKINFKPYELMIDDSWQSALG